MARRQQAGEKQSGSCASALQRRASQLPLGLTYFLLHPSVQQDLRRNAPFLCDGAQSRGQGGFQRVVSRLRLNIHFEVGRLETVPKLTQIVSVPKRAEFFVRR